MLVENALSARLDFTRLSRRQQPALPVKKIQQQLLLLQIKKMLVTSLDVILATAVFHQPSVNPYGFYQPKKWQTHCESCDSGTTTFSRGATSKADCAYACGPGEHLSPAEICEKCPLGKYRNASMAKCEGCPAGFTTATTGADNLIVCDVVERGRPTTLTSMSMTTGENLNPDASTDETIIIIVAIVVGGVVAIVGILAIIYCMRKRKRKRTRETSVSDNESHKSSEYAEIEPRDEFSYETAVRSSQDAIVNPTIIHDYERLESNTRTESTKYTTTEYTKIKSDTDRPYSHDYLVPVYCHREGSTLSSVQYNEGDYPDNYVSSVVGLKEGDIGSRLRGKTGNSGYETTVM